MNAEDFSNNLYAQIQKCVDTLGVKAAEYASDADRLRNFKIAATLEGVTPRQALGGMMAKHSVSIFDMIRDAPDDFSMTVWSEKITDHLNYLFLLGALVAEEHQQAIEATNRKHGYTTC